MQIASMTMCLDCIESDWRPVNEYPTIIGRTDKIAIDIETFDPNLKKLGPGAIRKDGFIAGFSIATIDGKFCRYYPIRHPIDNVESPESAVSWIKNILESGITIIGANIRYDMEWFFNEFGIKAKGRKYDVLTVDALINENHSSYNLDSVARRTLGKRKEEDLINKAAHFIYGKNIDVKSNLHKLPGRYVGQYAETDVLLPIELFKAQAPIIEKQGLSKVLDIEMRLIDCLFDMRQKGVRIDVEKAEELSKNLDNRIKELQYFIKRRTGCEPNINSGESIGYIADKIGAAYETTEKTNKPKINDEFFKKNASNEVIEAIKEWRSIEKINSTFIKNYILQFNVNGRIHPNFNPVKSSFGHDDIMGGTGIGRFSSSYPNLQNIPNPEKIELGRTIRSLFLPEIGAEWACFDYSQQEFWVMLHFAVVSKLRGAQELLNRRLADPSIDFHQVMADMAHLTRNEAKPINLGKMYNMGAQKLAIKTGKTLAQATEVLNKYDSRLPFVKELSALFDQRAQRRGWIKTFLGRRRHFDLWEPAIGKYTAYNDTKAEPLPYKEAERIYGPKLKRYRYDPLPFNQAVEKYGAPLKRAHTWKAMQSGISGSSADMIKVAMLACYDNGYVPMLTIHDELDFSVFEESNIRDILGYMIEPLKLTVPMKIEVKKGVNWGMIKKH